MPNFYESKFAKRNNIQNLREHQTYITKTIFSPDKNHFISGPRQVGKTTAIINLLYEIRNVDINNSIYFLSPFSALNKEEISEIKGLNVEFIKSFNNISFNSKSYIILEDLATNPKLDSKLDDIITMNPEIMTTIEFQGKKITLEYEKLIVISTPKNGSRFNTYCKLCRGGLLNCSRLHDLTHEYTLHHYLPQIDPEYMSHTKYEEEIKGFIF